jgi:hypothetical protein
MTKRQYILKFQILNSNPDEKRKIFTDIFYLNFLNFQNQSLLDSEIATNAIHSDGKRLIFGSGAINRKIISLNFLDRTPFD